ncbi:SDR family NAD(P)-dependent oxidoreductase [Solirubrobacter ginsenosidimutans]|uniref:SDR family NAD(P)-dependent oxidoreductase n=1 Tax=Solirubrobacter ginsenosidimutans TaxID=490573 RepID=A0A9X3N4B1_9ACTN|nr:SDR family NAD(P)-dependent oxidoreductase [Solirubrobacter ginsenosidimutans]MDA0166848.1 SDR family NAD(P)-dependent oxidoreductase [Solirubrobacter ginsenosidimutans]
MPVVVWISGASSGIGAALAASVPYDGARVLGISRRPPPVGEHVDADLSDPAAWARVAAHFEQVLSGAHTAVFLHMAGVATPIGPAIGADADAYTAAVLVNCASGLVLGKAFLDACRTAGAEATLVVCSSPAAATPVYGASHYGAGKAALQYWAATVATEVDSRVLCVVPHAVDTPMVRGTIAQPPGVTPISDHLRTAAERGALATPEATAAQIWSLVLDETTPETAVPVGAVPTETRITT